MDHGWGEILAQGFYEAVFHFFVGVHQGVTVNGLLIVLNGEVTGLVQERDGVGPQGIHAGEDGGRYPDAGNVAQGVASGFQILDQEGGRSSGEPVFSELKAAEGIKYAERVIYAPCLGVEAVSVIPPGQLGIALFV